GFRRFLGEPALEPVIEDAVARMTSITFEAARLANLYVLHLLNTNQAVPPLDYNHFMRLPFQAVLRRSQNDGAPKDTSDEALNHVRDTDYASCRPQGLEWNDGEYVTRYAIRDMFVLFG